MWIGKDGKLVIWEHEEQTSILGELEDLFIDTKRDAFPTSLAFLAKNE